MQQFEHYLFRKEDINGLRQLYYKDLLGLHENRQFQNINGDIFEGKIIGVDDIGRLQVEENTVINTYDIKEIKFLF